MRGPVRFSLFTALGAAFLLASCASAPTAPAPAAAPAPAGFDSGIAGKVLLKETGKPMAGAHVYAYRDMTKNLFGVADDLSRSTAEDGSYRLPLAPGDYGVVARKRQSGATSGPLSTGDMYDNRAGLSPVTVRAGAFTPVDFSLLTMREPMFFKRDPTVATLTGVKGRVVDEKGFPVPGAFAIAYDSSDMKRLPDYASTLTDDSGRFTLFLPKGGTYWLGARTHVRDMPKPEEPYALYDGTRDHSLAVREGSFVEGVGLVLRPFKGSYQPGRISY